jgi:N-acetylneuraminate synthase
MPSSNVPVTIIAEAGVNHNGDMDMAFRLIDAAVEAGADIVKFQSFVADRLATRTAPKANYQERTTDSSESQHAMLKRLELSPQMHHDLMAHCQARGIRFLSTPFDVESLHFLTGELGLTLTKIPSGEATNGPLLLAAARSGVDIILSTGMCDLDDIRRALEVIAFGFTGAAGLPDRETLNAAYADPAIQKQLSDKVSLLHCTTEYPAPAETVNLRAMETMRRSFGIPVGYSDHTMGIKASVAAAACGATIIEKHFTLSRDLPGPDQAASLEPAELQQMVAGIRTVEALLGSDEKKCAAAEEKNVAIARKSLVAARPIASGTIISEDDIIAKRPAGGISPIDFWRIIGCPADRDYAADEMIDAAILRDGAL